MRDSDHSRPRTPPQCHSHTPRRGFSFLGRPLSLRGPNLDSTDPFSDPPGDGSREEHSSGQGDVAAAVPPFQLFASHQHDDQEDRRGGRGRSGRREAGCCWPCPLRTLPQSVIGLVAVSFLYSLTQSQSLPTTLFEVSFNSALSYS